MPALGRIIIGEPCERLIVKLPSGWADAAATVRELARDALDAGAILLEDTGVIALEREAGQITDHEVRIAHELATRTLRIQVNTRNQAGEIKLSGEAIVALDLPAK